MPSVTGKVRNRYPEISTQKKIRESALEAWCGSVAVSCGWQHRKFKTPSRVASPDRMFFKMIVKTQVARIFFVEFKADGKIASPAQLQEHKVLRDAGVTVYVCDTKQSFLDVFIPEDQALLERAPSNDPADWL